MSRAGILSLLLCVCCVTAQSMPDLGSGSGSGQCPKPGSEVHGYSTFFARPIDHNAFVQELQQTIKPSRAEPGNIDYFMFTDKTKPGVIGYYESYKSLKDMLSHLTQDHITSIFGHPYYTEMRTKPADLYGPWKEVIPEEDQCEKNEELEMVFYWVQNCSAKHVWDVITNWTDASWVQGEPETTIIPLDENGEVMSEEEAAQVEDIDSLIQGGLGPVVQRRTWSNGVYLDVRMLTKTEENFTTIQETLSELIFPTVKYDQFFVTLSLDTEGLDPDTQSRMRYHVRATMKEGTIEEGRENLKNDFYGPRIEYYQEYFNCTRPLFMKRALSTVEKVQEALEAPSAERLDKLEGLFEIDVNLDEFVTNAIGEDVDPRANVSVSNVIAMFPLPDLRVVTVEDIEVIALSGNTVNSRIAIYQLNEWGRVMSVRIFDKPRTEYHKGKDKKLLQAMDKYYRVLEKRDIKKVEKLYIDDPVILDPVSYRPPRTFESVYTNFYTLADDYEYFVYDPRQWVDRDTMQVAQVVDATFQLADGGGELKSLPVQIFTFNERYKITMFEAFFVPTVIDFSELE